MEKLFNVRNPKFLTEASGSIQASNAATAGAGITSFSSNLVACGRLAQATAHLPEPAGFRHSE
ncbi:hypothetical protein [Burkholderia sp. TSV86]|uniref:hypothetical protein n=1 Tax=Burkholderia sp. TSV86 TaxID=1385594 RepID=UPI001E6028E2|nr:hypothetical protein [Burkholderia sp. TSV86]